MMVMDSRRSVVKPVAVCGMTSWRAAGVQLKCGTFVAGLQGSKCGRILVFVFRIFPFRFVCAPAMKRLLAGRLSEGRTLLPRCVHSTSSGCGPQWLCDRQ